MRRRKTASRADSGDTLSAEAEISVDGRSIHLKLVVPAGKVAAEALLPTLHQFSKQVAESVEEKALEAGKEIACQKGCGACCRQPVPLTAAEARHLAALVAAMPEPERTTTTERFDKALAKARKAGLAETMLGLKRMNEKEKRAMAAAYFDLGIACPFLVDESCSIHPLRPLVCREYLVTSSPEHCKNLDGPKINRLPFPAPITQTFAQLETESEPAEDRFMLLISALHWASNNPERGIERPGPEWVQEFFQKLSRSEIPSPSPYL